MGATIISLVRVFIGQFFLATLIVLSPLFSLPAFAQEQKTIQISVTGESKFDLIYYRAASNGTGAALGGLLGAGIQAGVESGKDETKRNVLREQLSHDTWKDNFLKTLEESFAVKNYSVIWAEDDKIDKKEKADIYITVYPKLHGYRLVDTSTWLVSAFVEFQASYTQEPPGSAGNAKVPKEAFSLTNKKQEKYETLASDAAEINGDLEAVLMQAAQRLANKVIYNVKP